MTQQPLEHASFDKPDEVREGDNWRLELVNLAGGAQVGRITIQPGWRWSEHVKPVAGTELCMAPHQQYQLSGRIHVLMADGTEVEAGPGEIASLPPGHDAWVVGDEPVVAIDWQGASVWARPRKGDQSMRFIQIIEFTTGRIEELDALFDQWLAQTQGKRTATAACKPETGTGRTPTCRS